MRLISLIACNTLLAFALAEGAARIAEWVHPPASDLAFDYAPYRMLRMSRAPWPLNQEGFRARELDTYRGGFSSNSWEVRFAWESEPVRERLCRSAWKRLFASTDWGVLKF